MRLSPFVLPTFLLLSACSPEVEAEPSDEPAPPPLEFQEAFQGILDRAGVAGAVVVLDASSGAFHSNDHAEAERGTLPASTFKIPNSIIALETGVVEDEITIFTWDGEPRFLSVWEQDLDFREAFQRSCVPCYQEIARGVGVERMRTYLARFGYGGMEVDEANLDRFWLEGESRISPREQVEFLRRLHHSELPIQGRTAAIMKRIMVMEEGDGWVLSGKTGWATPEGRDLGWFVGILEVEGGDYFVATRVEPLDGFDMDGFAEVRREIAMEAFQAMGVIPRLWEGRRPATAPAARSGGSP